MQINWESFKAFNQDAQGVRLKFENLCRQIFANENLSKNKEFRYLHANPNNYGIETEPIYDEMNQRWIGFQAKFFDGDVDYEKIKDSARKIVEYYTGKVGYVNLVYLFSNKPITSTAKGYVDTVSLLKRNNIDLQLVTDNAILDLVKDKYPYLGMYYFGNHPLKPEWFFMHANHMFDELGERYNREFNVQTEILDELSLFVHDQRAVKYVNEKKEKLLNEIDKKYCEMNKGKLYLRRLRDVVSGLNNVDASSLYNAENWIEIVKSKMRKETKTLTKEIEAMEKNRESEFSIALAGNKTEEEKKKSLQICRGMDRIIRELKKIRELPKMIALEDVEKKLLYGQIMMLYGDAGTGKSHLLAMKTKTLLDDKRIAVLLLGGVYFTNEPIQEQIMKKMRLDFCFEQLIDMLETFGEMNNCIIPIFIDAINETWNKRLWQTDLPSIIDKIRQAKMVRLVISYRLGYENIVLPELMRGEKNDIVKIRHNGFYDNSLEAIKEFLNHYSIPFTPLEYFNYEMSNPLFLTLYCKTYDGQEVSLPILYERLIEHASLNISRTYKQNLFSNLYSCDSNFLEPLIGQIAEYLIEYNKRFISKSDILRLNYWKDYGITPVPCINCLIKENILHDYAFDEEEELYFAYDQMNDYYCAKAILKRCKSKEEVRRYLAETVLGIKKAVLHRFENIYLFVNTCVLYAEKYKEECIDILDELGEDDDKRKVFSKYIRTFKWRNETGISADSLIAMLKKYPCERDDLWPVLIENSVKVSHPLNGDFLHKFLAQYELSKRDYLWTIYINELTWDESNRIVQLIELYNSGGRLKFSDEKQVELLLILMGWLLTSSNRWLRDYTSKAMIEILKDNFTLCKHILETFKDVNDPYVVQRLYGIIFGACCKRKDEDLRELAEYVYESVFNQEKVYPDILLRDYARLIIEKYLVEAPTYCGKIKREKITPPYISAPIPKIENNKYLMKEYDGAMRLLIESMKFEGMGMYGDFGRYVFQSALHNFEIDDKEMFNYAIYYILNNLGFNGEYFDNHDGRCVSYNRYLTIKTERIGKKYQWITMYNMLARISDNCKMIDRWNYPPKDNIIFEGAWDPYVRDFDPTLNVNFMTCAEMPYFKYIDDYLNKGAEENNTIDISSVELQKTWINHKGVLFEKLQDTLIMDDENGQQWICLSRWCDTGRGDWGSNKLLVWIGLHSYFMTIKQAENFKEWSKNGKSIFYHDIVSSHQTYAIFCREYPWAPSCKEFEKNAWIDAYVNTGEDEKNIGKILHSTSSILWEEEYDATKDKAISISMPCGKMIKDMGLRQLKEDGVYYDKFGNIAAFDTKLTQNIDSVIVRKDILDVFLSHINMKLVWFVNAEKEIHTLDGSTASWSNWEAVLTYEGGEVIGDIHRLQTNGL